MKIVIETYVMNYVTRYMAEKAIEGERSVKCKMFHTNKNRTPPIN